MLNGVNLYLIGMMGVGKTTIGQPLARHFGYQFVDTDHFIERATGQSISTIFAQSGEAIFRQLETATLAEVSARTCKVIATGGGIVLKRENWSFLRHGVIIWLDVPVEVLQNRLRHDANRPLLHHDDLRENLIELLNERQALYAQADIRIRVAQTDTAEQVVQRTIAAIADACEQKRQLDQHLERLNAEVPFQLHDPNKN
ncbi:shikimate kinase [Myxacorys almedinensis]|uniref:Shikimate kinase n=1 Tax=Myxacorys almedinensis A TaxID=2690445 RepID=A0A8J8CLZ4_9CYAN|nr:shikimate kinase [Myxacorys almedinensis]NDJ16667.1 shikimate kinase [Myxacorys almedinensis A]